jgi:site-specific DNA-methyltransferase (adenine-specific)
MVDPSTLKPWDRNPRLNDDTVPMVAESIKRFGFAAPIIARMANGEIIAGHTRWRAAMQLGLKSVPVRYMDLSEKEAHVLALADNRLTEVSRWNDAELHSLLSEVSPEDMTIAGWSSDDMDALTRQLVEDGVLAAPVILDDDIPDAPVAPITQLGDVWELGDHRVVCGDARDFSCMSKALCALRADMVFTDPPYGVDYVGGSHADSREERLAEGRPVVHNDGADTLEPLLRAVFPVAMRACKPGAVWYVCAPPGRTLLPFLNVLADLDIWRHTIAWVKHSMVFGRADFHYQHENVLYGWVPGAAHRPPYDSKQTTVWKFDRPSASPDHPTVKPVGLVAHAIDLSTQKGDLIFDPFLGSGTTVIAAEQLGRRCAGIEISPAYVDVAVRRWEALTGKKGVRLPASENV